MSAGVAAAIKAAIQRILFSLHSVTSNFLSVLMNGFISNNVAMCLLQTINPPQNGKEFTQ